MFLANDDVSTGPICKAYHGVRWLKRKDVSVQGALMARCTARRRRRGDFDGDGDQDVAAVSFADWFPSAGVCGCLRSYSSTNDQTAIQIARSRSGACDTFHAPPATGTLMAKSIWPSAISRGSGPRHLAMRQCCGEMLAVSSESKLTYSNSTVFSPFRVTVCVNPGNSSLAYFLASRFLAGSVGFSSRTGSLLLLDGYVPVLFFLGGL
jgi:hypothetical protein